MSSNEIREISVDSGFVSRYLYKINTKLLLNLSSRNDSSNGILDSIPAPSGTVESGRPA